MATASQFYCSCSKGNPTERRAAASKPIFCIGTTEICLIHDVIWFRNTPGDIAEGDLPNVDKATLTMMLKPEKLEEATAGGAPVVNIHESQLGL